MGVERTSFDAFRGLTVRFLESVLVTSMRRRGWTPDCEGRRFTVPITFVVPSGRVGALELVGRIVAKTQASSSSATARDITVSLLYISGFERRSPRRASHSSRLSMSSWRPSVAPALRMNRCFNNSRATIS